jgi:polysaccharide biosynthesis/export protein
LIRVERKALDSFQEDPRLVHGDRVFVPKAPIFFINGHVKAGGTQVWVPGMTVGKAIAAAGGISERGTQRGLKIKRMVDGVFKEFKANVNTLVQPEDQIIVAQRRF